MSSSLSPPPRSHSLRIIASETLETSAISSSENPFPRVAQPDTFGVDDDEDAEQEKYLSDELVKDARDAIERVEDGWSAVELINVGRKLADRVQHLTSVLSRLREAQSDLETVLTVTKSNLTLALSNTEMLEEALHRADSGKGKDIGWRRWSDREGLKRSNSAQVSATPRGVVLEEGSSPESSTWDERNTKRHTHHAGTESETPNHTPASPAFQRSHSDVVPPSITPPTPTSTPTATPTFFTKFRFGGGSITPSIATSKVSSSQMASASLPALGTSLAASFTPEAPPPLPLVSDLDRLMDSDAVALSKKEVLLRREKQRADALEQLLEREKKASAVVKAEKKSIEEELENLSAALFEEANKMVAEERIKRAEAEEELKNANSEKEALRSALRIVESENKAARGTPEPALIPPVETRNSPSKGSQSALLEVKQANEDMKLDLIETPVQVELDTSWTDPGADNSYIPMVDASPSSSTHSSPKPRIESSRPLSPILPSPTGLSSTAPLRLRSPSPSPQITTFPTSPTPVPSAAVLPVPASSSTAQLRTPTRGSSVRPPVHIPGSKTSVSSLKSSLSSSLLARDADTGAAVSRVPLSPRIARAAQAFGGGNSSPGGGDARASSLASSPRMSPRTVTKSKLAE